MVQLGVSFPLQDLALVVLYHASHVTGISQQHVSFCPCPTWNTSIRDQYLLLHSFLKL